MFRAIGQPVALRWLGLYLSALVIAGSISAFIAILRGGRPLAAPAPDAQPVAPPAPPPTTSLLAPSLLAQRAGLPDLADVRHVVAEDHYLQLADGSEQAVSETHLPVVRAAGWLRRG
ncbi:hypothetical protein CHU93_07015 [Sandarakinorhabdus cyanobacteriorum]|uniref:Uncharacterized protein n=2 Tax=Sandarakinorhabdus cyanobacteriorum TaxID=1981098 RepID=A0A255YN58_9SPHN|nr:hypothetical protein CHU93_07015 [Sandarakinorhabdus cyanobacteriorum]